MTGNYPTSSAPTADSHSDEFFTADIPFSASRSVKAGVEAEAVITFSRSVAIEAGVSFLILAQIGAAGARAVKLSADIEAAINTPVARSVKAGLETVAQILPARASAVEATERQYFVVAEIGTARARVEKAAAVVGAKIASARAAGIEADIDYLVEGLPELRVTKQGNDVLIDVTNLDVTPVRIFRGTRYRIRAGGKYEAIALVNPVNFPYTDEGVSEDKKYKAAFTVEGTKDGEPHTTAGQKTRPKPVKFDS